MTTFESNSPNESPRFNQTFKKPFSPVKTTPTGFKKYPMNPQLLPSYKAFDKRSSKIQGMYDYCKQLNVPLEKEEE